MSPATPGARRAQLFRLYEGCLRNPRGSTEQLRWELRTLGVPVAELHAFKTSVMDQIKKERNGPT